MHDNLDLPIALALELRAPVGSGLRVPVERDHGFRWKMITQSGAT